MEYVNYEEFKKMDMRVGTIREVTPVPDTDKLLKCIVDFGETEEVGEEGEEKAVQPKFRQIVSGIREFFPEYEKLVGKQVLYIVNLEPRMIKGIESQGMLMAVDGANGNPVFMTPEVEVNPGTKIR
ncbi:MAG: tRNA-binding protein [Patescibacteria group bacterium]|jgi:methionyl-tRNA synthetase|nr:tRNA-binding protein [Patescibacteria group bacterium]